MTDHQAERPSLGGHAVRIAALWILTGALFKLSIGSPNDLPALVKDVARDFLGLGASQVFRLAIAIELSIAVPALLRPRLVWPLVAAQLAVFCGVLVPLVLAGAKTCGCFGSKVPFPPWAMLAVDGALLVALLVLRPWRARRPARQLLVPIAGALALAWVLPYSIVPSGAAPLPQPTAGGSTSERRALPRFIEWAPERWVGKPLRESGLAPFLDVDLYPQDATWVIYSPTCEHCAAYLRQLEGEFLSDPKLYVFVRLPGDEGQPPQVDAMPPGEEALLPGEVAYVITPPWALDVEAGVVASALHPDV